jgi:hypothetical protein
MKFKFSNKIAFFTNREDGMLGESKVHTFVHHFDGRHLRVDIYVRVIDECIDETVIGG